MAPKATKVKAPRLCYSEAMARIKIVHTTEYRYRNPVGLTRHRLMLRPDDSHDCRLHEADLEVDPTPSLIHWTHDAYDNSVCYLEWPETLRADCLRIVSTLDLTHHPDGPASADLEPRPERRVLSLFL